MHAQHVLCALRTQVKHVHHAKHRLSKGCARLIVKPELHLHAMLRVPPLHTAAALHVYHQVRADLAHYFELMHATQ
jgi:hypothetical protein